VREACREKFIQLRAFLWNVLQQFDATGRTSAYDRRNEFRRIPPLRRGDGEQMPLAGHALEPRERPDPLAFRHELFHDLVDAEAGGLGAGREILEAFQPLRNKGLCGIEQEGAVGCPLGVVDVAFVAALERV
jgi:hypothetical protein